MGSNQGNQIRFSKSLDQEDIMLDASDWLYMWYGECQGVAICEIRRLMYEISRPTYYADAPSVCAWLVRAYAHADWLRMDALDNSPQCDMAHAMVDEVRRLDRARRTAR